MQIQLKPNFRNTAIGALILFILTLLDQVEGEWAAGGMIVLATLYQRQRAKLKQIQAEAEATVLKGQETPDELTDNVAP